MRASIKKFIQQCGSCQRVKARAAKPQGLLMPLPVPESRWHTVTMDFITDLPLTKRGNTAVVVFTDKLTKMIHVAPTTKTCSSEEAAQLLVDNVVRLHGVPKELVSDRDSRFTADFFHRISGKIKD